MGAPDMDTTWLADLERVIETYKTTDNLPKKLTAGHRCSGWTCFPLFCAPCVLWSAVWRVLCCPVQCGSKGFYYSCSNNSCTTASDFCIEEYTRALDERVKVELPAVDLFRTLSPRDMQRVENALDDLDVWFSSPADLARHYALAACVFNCRPADVPDKIRAMRAAVKVEAS